MRERSSGRAVRACASLHRRIKYNQTRQTRVMNQIISDRVVVGGIIYPARKGQKRLKRTNCRFGRVRVYTRRNAMYALLFRQPIRR